MLPLLIVVGAVAFSAAAQTQEQDRTLTVIIVPPIPGGSSGKGCPAQLPDGGVTEYWSDFQLSADGPRFPFKDPLPSGAKLKSIDVTIVGAATSQGESVKVYLNAGVFGCSDGLGQGYLLGTLFPQVTPFQSGTGECMRMFNQYTVKATYDDVAARNECSPYPIFFGDQFISFGGTLDFDYSSITATLHYTLPDFTATAQILDGSAEESKPIFADTTTYAQVPLGLELQLGIKDAKGDYLPATFQLLPATLTGLEKVTLYPTNAVLEYGRTVSEKQKTFRGVHIGTQTLTVTPTVFPDDTKIPKFTFTLGVFDPGSLGNTDVQYDQMFVDWGNKRGIPPHILKGLVRQEGPFDPFSYRYEPISNTTGDRYIQSMLAAPIYSSYILATSTGLGQGTLLTADDIEPRNVFTITRANGTTGPMTVNDVCPTACVSARQIFEENDGVQNWSAKKFVGKTNWWDPANLKLLEFTAQTPLAASYGLMQTMYVKATELNWVTTDGRRNPALLFDTPANQAIGGGSVAVGTLELYKAYRACHTADLATDPDFANNDAYKSQNIDAMNWYNHGNAKRNLTYGDDAWAYSQQFTPSHPLSKIFP
jgi:hypothetical protein